MQPWVRDPVFDVARGVLRVAGNLQKFLKFSSCFYRRAKFKKKVWNYIHELLFKFILFSEVLTGNFDYQENER